MRAILYLPGRRARWRAPHCADTAAAGYVWMGMPMACNVYVAVFGLHVQCGRGSDALWHAPM
eukprot:10415624-Lingulodinium_polyedra.AAC.1